MPANHTPTGPQAAVLVRKTMAVKMDRRAVWEETVKRKLLSTRTLITTL